MIVCIMIFTMIIRSLGCSRNLSVEMLGFWTKGGRPMVDRSPVDVLLPVVWEGKPPHMTLFQEFEGW